MSETYEDMSIIINASIDNAIGKTAMDLNTFVQTMRQSGASDQVIRNALLKDLDVGGRIFGQFKNGMKNATKNGVTSAGNIASQKTYVDAGVKNFKWITVSAKPCDDCLRRHDEVGTMEYFSTIGLPKSGFSVCGIHCQCQLEPVAYKGKGLDKPVIRKKK
jgi:hypothetical protein